MRRKCEDTQKTRSASEKIIHTGYAREVEEKKPRKTFAIRKNDRSENNSKHDVAKKI